MRTRVNLRARPHALALAALLLFQPLSQGAVPSFYTVTPVLSAIGDPLGVQGLAINDLGAVAGLNGGQPFLWNGAGNFSTLLNAQGTVGGLNNSGAVVGQAPGVLVDGQLASVAVSWQSGAMTVLSPLDPLGVQTNGMATAVNGQGWIAGVNAAVGGPLVSPNTGMLWGPNGQSLSLGEGFRPTAINNQNTVVGTSIVAGIGAPAVWTPGGGLRELPLPLGSQGNAMDINEPGQVVGFYTPAGASGSSPFRWDAQAGFQTLALPQGALSGIVNALNNEGLAVGGATFIDNTHGFGWPWDGRSNPLMWDAGAMAPVNLANLAHMPGGGTLADAGLWWLSAVDINARGQVLVNGFRFTTDIVNGPAFTNWETFVLSPCTRCGQINPNPNPAGATLAVATDWVDAYNGLHYDNAGSLALGTVVVNRVLGTLSNTGNLGILVGGTLTNDGLVVNQAAGRLFVDGTMDNRSGEVLNHGAAVVRDTATLALFGRGWTNTAHASFLQQGGSIVNAARFSSVGAVLTQEGGAFDNAATGEYIQSGGTAMFAGQVSNRGTMRFTSDGSAVPSVPAQVTLQGQFQNVASGQVRMEGGSHAVVEAGGQWTNRGEMQLADAGTQLVVRVGGSLVNEAGTVRLGAGSQLLLEPGSGAGQPSAPPGQGGTDAFRQSGRLFVAHGAHVEIGSTRSMDVIGGSVSNDGVIVVRAGADITNSGRFQLQIGSRLELDGGANFEQGLGELYVAAGASILGAGVLNHFGGTTTVNGSISLPVSIFSGGVLAGSGVITGGVVLAGALDLRPGNSPGTFTIDGDLRVEDVVQLSLEVADYRTFDRLVVSGATEIADFSSLHVVFTPTSGYEPDLNDSFQWLSAGAGSTGLDRVSLDGLALPAGWEAQTDASGRLSLWNASAFELPEGGVSSYEVAAGTLQYLSPQRAGSGYEALGNLWVSGLLAVQSQAVMNVRGPLSVEVGGRLSNRGLIEAFQGLRNQGRIENRDDGVLMVHGSAGLLNEGVLVNSGRLNADGRITNAAGARFENHGLMTATDLRNEGQFIVTGTTTLSGVVNNYGRIEIGRGGRMEALQYLQFSDTAVTRVDGELLTTEDRRVEISSGALEGTGHVHGILLLGGDPPSGPKATVRPGGRDAVGTLTADFVQVGRADFEVDIASAQSLDQMVAPQGFLVREGEVHFRLLDGFLPDAGSSLTWLVTDPSLTAGFGPELLSWSVSLVRADQTEWWLGGSSGHDENAPLRFSFDGVQLNVSAVPEPGTWALMLAGVLLVLVASRRGASTLSRCADAGPIAA